MQKKLGKSVEKWKRNCEKYETMLKNEKKANSDNRF